MRRIDIAKILFAALIAVFVAGALLVPVPVSAQAVSGDLSGLVKDASGAVVTTAIVEAENLATGYKASSPTNSVGQYHISNLPIGKYRVTAAGAGLTAAPTEVEVQLNRTINVNITMTVGAKTTEVIVTEQAVSVDTTTATIQTSYEVKQAQDLPTASVGLGVLNLSLLQAGVGSSGGIGAGTGPSVSGQRPRNNNFTIEGVDNNDKSVTGPLATVPNDAVASFTVLQNNFSPEFGHSSGGQFNTLIMSGSNNFHGRAYEYFQNRKLNAQNWQVARTINSSGIGTENLRYDNNRFGGQVGGPILKDKLFFFTNWEYNPIGQVGGAASFCAPTAAGYTALTGLAGISANNLTILKQYLPAAAASTTDCGANNAAGNFTANSKGYSLVNGVEIPVGEVGFTGPSYNNTLTTANSIDWNPTTQDQVRFRYVYVKNTFFDTAASLPTFWQTLPYKVHFGSLAEYHTFSPKLTNEFRIGYNRNQAIYDVGGQAYPGLAMFPNVTLNDLNGVNIGPDPNAPQGGNQNTYQLTDNISWMLGRHNLKFGVEGRKLISPQFFTQRVRGDYAYGTTGSTSGLAEFLTDVEPSNFGERSTGNPQYAGDQYAIYSFFNDEWHVTSQLTLNLGMRYEFTQTPAGTGLQGLNSIADVPGLVNFARPKAQKKNFAPRIGFAYSPGKSGDTSIRGGFAMAYDVIYDNLPLLSLPPELSGTCDVGQTPTASCHWSSTGFLANGGLPLGGTGVTPYATAAAARTDTAAYMPNQALPYSESWNLGIQHIFQKKYIAEVRYVGSKGIHLTVQDRINRVPKVNPTRYLPTYLTDPGAAVLNALPYALSCSSGCPAGVTGLNTFSNYDQTWFNAGFDGASVVGFMPYGSSIYHGLQSQVTRNFTNGLQFQAAWTWSHMFDNSTADVFSTVLTPRRAQDWTNFRGERSVSALDHRHRFTLQAIYDIPFFKKDNNWIKKNVLSNWEFAPIWTFESPEFATVQSGADANLNGDAAGDRSIINYSGVPNTSSAVTPLPNSSGNIVAYLAVDPNAYYIQARSGALSTAHRNTLAMPRINNWDLTAIKKITVREGMNVEFQMQALNVFNHAQWIPGLLNQINSTGQSSAAVQSILTTGSATFNKPSNVFSNQPRSLQLVLKFTF